MQLSRWRISVMAPLYQNGIWRECDPSAKLITCRTRWWFNDWIEKGLHLLKHLIHNRWSNIVGIDKVWCLYVRRKWTTEDFLWVSPKKARKAEEKFVCRSSRVELCSSRESAPLVLLPFVSSPPTQNPNVNFYMKRFLKPLFEKNVPRVWEGLEFCRAVRQRPSLHGRGHRLVSKKFRLQLYSCTESAR